MFASALVWRLTGERKYLDVVKTHAGLKRPTWVFGWAATVDLVWDDLTAAERRELSDLAARSMKKGGSEYWRPTLHVASVF